MHQCSRCVGLPIGDESASKVKAHPSVHVVFTKDKEAYIEYQEPGIEFPDSRSVCGILKISMVVGCVGIVLVVIWRYVGPCVAMPRWCTDDGLKMFWRCVDKAFSKKMV